MRGNTADFGPIENPGMVFIAIVFAAICYFVAAAKNRNPVTWGILGLFFGWISLIILICIKSKK